MSTEEDAERVAECGSRSIPTKVKIIAYVLCIFFFFLGAGRFNVMSLRHPFTICLQLF